MGIKNQDSDFRTDIIETGAFELADDSLTAAKQLLIRFPDAQIFGIRIGHRAVHRFGFRSSSVLPFV
jgi:hypothetical protein